MIFNEGEIGKNPEKVEMIIKYLSHRLRKLTDRYMDACSLVYEIAETEDVTDQISDDLEEKIRSYKTMLFD